MSIVPPAAGEPRRPDGPRDPGDAWVIAPSGERYWGRFGAAGLLAYDRDRRAVLLQHRVSWSHFGGTWALPGGARHEGESAVDGALRESAEEAGVPAGSIRPRLMSVLDLDVWTYATLVGDVVVPFEPVISDPESNALEWVAVDEIEGMPLHPAFASAWAGLRALLDLRPALVIDAANVVGSVPDGWWRDRAGASGRLVAELEALLEEGMDAGALALPATRWYPELVLVVEGQAKAVNDTEGQVRIVRANGEGDETIVAEVRALVDAGRSVTAVTGDRALRARVEALGATVHGAGWLRGQFG